MADFPRTPKQSSPRAPSEETGGSSTPPRARIHRSSRVSSTSRQPRGSNGIPQLQPGGMEPHGPMDGFRTSMTAVSSMGLNESSARSFLDIVGLLSDNPVAMAALLGPQNQHWRSTTTGLFVPPPTTTEASAWELAAYDPWFDAGVRPHEAPSRASIHQHVRDLSPLTGHDDDSGAPPSDEGAVADASCRRRHLRDRLLRTLDSVLDVLAYDPDDKPNRPA